MPFHLKRRYKISISHFNIHTALAQLKQEASSTTNLIQSSNFSLLQWKKKLHNQTCNTKLMPMLRMISSQNKQKYARLLYYFYARLCFDWEELGHDGVPLQLAPVDERVHQNYSAPHTCRSGIRTAFHEPNPKRTATGAKKQSLLLNQWIKLLELFGI